MPHGPFVLQMTNVSVSAAISLLQLKAGATTPLQLLEARISQSSSTTSTQQRAELVRKSVAATVTAFTALLENPADAAAAAVGGTAATGTNASAEGTDTDILLLWDFNILNGLLWLPAPEDRIWVAPAGMIALKFPAAPSAAITVDAQIKFLEYP